MPGGTPILARPGADGTAGQVGVRTREDVMETTMRRMMARPAGGAWRLVLALALILGLLGGTIALAPAARAAAYPCTEAGLDAALAAGGVATFNCAAATTITTSGTKAIPGNTTLDGGGRLTISGGGAHRVFTVASSATLRNLAITDGNGGGIGGGIINYGDLTLVDVTLSNNRSDDGGGIYNQNTLAVFGGTIRDNAASSEGGGIFNQRTMIMVGTTVSDNSSGFLGGGLFNVSRGTATLTDITFSDNTAFNGGGGMHNANAATATLGDVTFNENSSGLGDSGRGGGLDNHGTATLTNTTFSGNTSRVGGGMFNNGTATLTNATFTRDYSRTDGFGDAIANISGTTTLRNTILTEPLGDSNCSGNLSDGGGNVQSGSDCPFSAATSLSNTNAKLGPLAANGGLTPTHLPAADSPARGRGVAANCPIADQRGASRPAGACDSGAVQTGVSALTLTPLYLPPVLTRLPFSRQFAASGGTGPYRFTVVAGTLPLGLELRADGLLVGSPYYSGTYDFTLRATEQNGANPASGLQPYRLTINEPGIAIAPDTLPDAAIDTAYNQQFTASGETAPFTFQLYRGTLPPGLSLSQTGQLSGTPTEARSFNFTVAAYDTFRNAEVRDYTLVVVGRPQTITFDTPGGNPSYTVGEQFTVGATSSSGLRVSFTAEGACVRSGTTVTTTHLGNCRVVASQLGNTTYAPAPEVVRVFPVGKDAQTISFATPAGNTAYAVGDTFAVGATASSGLAVAFAASGPCTIAGTTVTAAGVGVCTVTASQPGDDTYAPAPDVARTFTIASTPPASSPSASPSPTPTPYASPTPAPSASPVPNPSPGGPAPSFADVPADYWAAAQIAQVARRGITTGCAPGEFCPERPVTRAEMAAFLIRAITGQTAAPAGPATPTFADVPADHPQYGFIEALNRLGVTTGCGGGDFCPDRKVTRAEMAAFIIRALTAQTAAPAGPAVATFGDVPADHPQYGFIEALVARTITTGCGDPNASPRTYCPGSNVTRAEMAVFIIRAYP